MLASTDRVVMVQRFYLAIPGLPRRVAGLKIRQAEVVQSNRPLSEFIRRDTEPWRGEVAASRAKID